MSACTRWGEEEVRQSYKSQRDVVIASHFRRGIGTHRSPNSEKQVLQIGNMFNALCIVNYICYGSKNRNIKLCLVLSALRMTSDLSYLY